MGLGAAPAPHAASPVAAIFSPHGRSRRPPRLRTGRAVGRERAVRLRAPSGRAWPRDLPAPRRVVGQTAPAVSGRPSSPGDSGRRWGAPAFPRCAVCSALTPLSRRSLAGRQEIKPSRRRKCWRARAAAQLREPGFAPSGGWAGLHGPVPAEKKREGRKESGKEEERKERGHGEGKKDGAGDLAAVAGRKARAACDCFRQVPSHPRKMSPPARFLGGFNLMYSRTRAESAPVKPSPVVLAPSCGCRTLGAAPEPQAWSRGTGIAGRPRRSDCAKRKGRGAELQRVHPDWLVAGRTTKNTKGKGNGDFIKLYCDFKTQQLLESFSLPGKSPSRV
ncbi:uncharacterized protein LOC111813707 [Octodon degus]|uniref:Uncharacterized protein LOC111813707 n=1 Tax=Octodon degus TaxID=10160 RepID=A0A6P6DLR0_OCTDE|nr:uncharacterized protein LOC111813707 [Octodon degus]